MMAATEESEAGHGQSIRRAGARRQPVPDGRGPAQAEERERDTFKSERPLRRRAAAGLSAKRAKFKFVSPQRARLAGVGDARGSEGGAPGLLRLGVAAASARAMRDAELAELIFRVGDEARNVYGAPKTLMRLRAPGVRARFPLERLHALRSLCRRRNQGRMGGIRAMVHKAQWMRHQ